MALPPDPLRTYLATNVIRMDHVLELLMLPDEELVAHVGPRSAKFLREFEDALWAPPDPTI